MSWGSKFVCIIVFLTSLSLVFAMGKSNVTNFNNINNSIKEIYEDRLVVNAIIYRLAVILHQKELALATNNDDFFTATNTENNKLAIALINQVKETHLTDLEALTLTRFETDFTALLAREEQSSFASSGLGKEEAVPTLLLSINELKRYLDQLTDIQLSEGKTKFVASKKAVESMTIFQTVEDYFLIVVSILVFIIILWPSSRTSR